MSNKFESLPEMTTFERNTMFNSRPKRPGGHDKSTAHHSKTKRWSLEGIVGSAEQGGSLHCLKEEKQVASISEVEKLSMLNLQNDPKIQECIKSTGPEYLIKVSEFVNVHRGQLIQLKKPPGSTLRIARLEDTIYGDQPDEVDAWGMFYLPEEVKMQVLGVIEGTSCPSDELVLMTCKDRRLYAYDGEDLHVVAPSLRRLKCGDIKYPSSESFYNGQAFEDMTEEDWAEVKKGPVGKDLDQKHKELVDSKKDKLLENLKSQK